MLRPTRRKRCFLLLEVLIALFLVTFCLLPLLSPYVALFREQQRFADRITIGHAVGIIYADIIEQLHKNSIPWSALEEQQEFKIDREVIEKVTGKHLPWDGKYFFKEIKHKPKEKDLFTLYLFNLKIILKPTEPKSKEEEISVDYTLCIARQLSDIKVK